MQLPASKLAALHRNVAHRAACLALYRRLLKHTQKTTNLVLPVTPTPPSSSTSPPLPPPIPPSQLRQSIKSIITREFKKYGNRDTAVADLRAALTLGYKVEKCLRLSTAVPPDPLELARLSAFLTLHRQRHETPPLVRMQAANITVQPPPKPKAPKNINPNLQLLPFDLRFKPTIIGGNTIPFVRYTGTKQSPELSGILNKKLKQKLKRDDLLEQLKWTEGYASAEDVFENGIWNEAGREWRKENPDENPAVEGYWKTEVTRAQMELQVKMWAHQVTVWERSGECMERIEDHKRRVKEFMTNLKAEKARAKGKDQDSVGKAETLERKSDIGGPDVQPVKSMKESVVDESGQEYPDSMDSQMDALYAQMEAAGFKANSQAVGPTKGHRTGAKKQERRSRSGAGPDDMDAQMEALNAQLQAAGFNPTSRISKPRKPSRSDGFEPRDYKNRGNRFESKDYRNNHGWKMDTRQNSHSRPRHDTNSTRPPRESKPQSKGQPSQKRHEGDEHADQKEGRKDNKSPQRHDSGAMLAGKGIRSRRGLDIGKVFGSDEPGS
ncbi:hypothetical protein TWF718_000772 [Orbilia javanica]|uniref:Uncharacterized protein n=1 Tax=Orbilia javanica TaxID=47235 RepID=A0AAN8RM92_9PEZI